MQRIEGDIRLQPGKNGTHIAIDIDTGDPVALGFERISTGIAGREGNRALA
jgi:hypothetical protein